MNYTSVTDLQWSDIEQNAINCVVNFDDIGTVPFTAHRDDNTIHGVRIYNECVAGMYGDIAAYIEPPCVEPPAPTLSELQAQLAALTAQINALANQ